MAGTTAGGRKSSEIMRAKMGDEAYRQHIIERGRRGGKKPGPKGYAVTPKRGSVKYGLHANEMSD